MVYLKGLSKEIAVDTQDVTQVAMELRTELLDNMISLIKGFFAINAVDRGMEMNEAALKCEEPIKYSADALVGVAKTAENHFKNCFT